MLEETGLGAEALTLDPLPRQVPPTRTSPPPSTLTFVDGLMEASGGGLGGRRELEIVGKLFR